MNDERPTITVTENGPYIVTGNVPIRRAHVVRDAAGKAEHWQDDGELTREDEVYLCRCGNSSHKPFCDDSHLTSSFDGTETALKDPFGEESTEYSGPTLKIKDAPSLCAAIGFCGRAGGIKALTAASDDPTARATAIQEAVDCPSGRLVAVDLTTGEHMEPQGGAVIEITQDPAKGVSGPLYVKGGVTLVASDGTEYAVRNRMALCRCGRSTNKPFCDGSHFASRFADGHEGAEQ